MKKLIIFDLDNTLYESRNFVKAFNRAVYKCISDTKNISLKDAEKDLKKARKIIQEQYCVYPGKTTALYLGYGVSVNRFEEYKLNMLSEEGSFSFNSKRFNKKLKDILLKLKSHYNLVLYTNNHKSLTDMVLNNTGLDSCFDKIYTINDIPRKLWDKARKPFSPLDEDDAIFLSFIKPSEKRLKEIAGDFKTELKDCISIGDRYKIDLMIPEALGMKTICIKKVKSILLECENLYNEALGH
jgi:phosphoglycolate phosphatase/putative hydrolase of the HAD superfamily